MESGDDSYVIDTELQEQLDLQQIDATAVGENPITVTYTKTSNVYKINTHGDVSFGDASGDVPSNVPGDSDPEEPGDIIEERVPVNPQSYGQYVYYPIDLNGDGDLRNDWKIFYNDGKNVFIIAADYLPNTATALNKDASKMAFDGTYVAYWENTPNNENVDLNILKRFMATEYTLNSENGNSKCAMALLNTNNWTGFVDNAYADFAIGSPTLEMWIESWNANYGSEAKLYSNAGESGYHIGDSLVTTDFSVNPAIITETSGYDETLFYPHQEAYSGCYGYWLASPSANSTEDIMYVGHNGSVNIDESTSGLLGIRPVVSLKSDREIEFSDATGVWEFVK